MSLSILQTTIATTIFKIRAWSDYLSKEQFHVSFRRGQAFYALSTNLETKQYFVSTQYSTPFARTAVCGVVPMELFEIEDLYGNPSPLKVAIARQQGGGNSLTALESAVAEKPARPVSKYESILNTIRSDAIAVATIIDYSVSKSEPASRPLYQMRVLRQAHTHTISRTFDDFVVMHNGLLRTLPAGSQLPILPDPIVNVNLLKQMGGFEARVLQQQQQLVEYLSLFCNTTPQEILQLSSVVNFFEPRRESEITNIIINRKESTVSYATPTPSPSSKQIQEDSISSKASQRLMSILGKNASDLFCHQPSKTTINPFSTANTTTLI